MVTNCFPEPITLCILSQKVPYHGTSARNRGNRRIYTPASALNKVPSIGVITMELRLEESHSLKDKRQVVRSLKDRLRRKFNISIAEIDGEGSWQRSTIAAVTVSPSRDYADQLLKSVEEDAASVLGPILVEVTVEWLA